MHFHITAAAPWVLPRQGAPPPRLPPVCLAMQLLVQGGLQLRQHRLLRRIRLRLGL